MKLSGQKVVVVAHKGWSTSRLQEVVIDYRDLTGKSLVLRTGGRFIESCYKWKFDCTLYFFCLS